MFWLVVMVMAIVSIGSSLMEMRKQAPYRVLREECLKHVEYLRIRTSHPVNECCDKSMKNEVKYYVEEVQQLLLQRKLILQQVPKDKIKLLRKRLYSKLTTTN